MKQLTISTIIILNFLPIQSSDGCFSNTRAFLRDKQLQKYVRCLDRAQQAADRYLYLLCHEYGHQDTPETLLAFATLTQAGTEAGATYYKMSDFRRQKLAELVWNFRVESIIDIYKPLKERDDAARIERLKYHGTSRKKANKKSGTFR